MNGVSHATRQALTPMIIPFAQFGAIHDHATGTVLDARALATEATARAATLKAQGAGPGAIVAITHGGTAAFFVDLLAVWSCGAAAACLDPALTESERTNVIAFCNPALVLH